MILTCPKCGRPIQAASINIGRDAAFCAACGEMHKASALMAPGVAPVQPAPYQGAPPPVQYQQPVYQPAQFLQQININMPKRTKSKMEPARLVIGIITIVFFCLLQIQSCAAGVLGIFDEGVGTSAGTGYIVSFFFLAAGIVSIACRKSKGGSLAAGGIYALCGLTTVNENFSVFKDLAFYCFLSFAFAVILIIGGVLQPNPKKYKSNVQGDAL